MSQPALRDLRPAELAPARCSNCWGARYRVVIVRRVAWWECARCHIRPAELAAARERWAPLT